MALNIGNIDIGAIFQRYPYLVSAAVVYFTTGNIMAAFILGILQFIFMK